MASNLLVVGVEQALSGHVVRAVIERGAPHVWSEDTRPSALRTPERRELAAARLLGEGSAARTGAGEAVAGLSAAAQLQRALAADAPLLWLAAPLVHRAIDAYRELMSVTV